MSCPWLRHSGYTSCAARGVGGHVCYWYVLNLKVEDGIVNENENEIRCRVCRG